MTSRSDSSMTTPKVEPARELASAHSVASEAIRAAILREPPETIVALIEADRRAVVAQALAPLRELLDELRALEAKATPGPWVVPRMGPGIWRGPLKENTRSCIGGANKEAGELFSVDPAFSGYAEMTRSEEAAERKARRDMKFIAAMRNALPELLKLLPPVEKVSE
jgi:hypothetical protein